MIITLTFLWMKCVGNIPDTIGLLTALKFMDLSNNELIGTDHTNVMSEFISCESVHVCCCLFIIQELSPLLLEA